MGSRSLDTVGLLAFTGVAYVASRELLDSSPFIAGAFAGLGVAAASAWARSGQAHMLAARKGLNLALEDAAIDEFVRYAQVQSESNHRDDEVLDLFEHEPGIWG